MYSIIEKTLDLLAKYIQARPLQLHKAYGQSVRLRNQLLAAIQGSEEFGNIGQGEGKPETLAKALTDGAADGEIVTLIIHETLPSHKEMTGVVQSHWVNLMQASIEKERQVSQNKVFFEKAFAWIEVVAPYTDNAQLWDTSNRAINLIINNLKGVYFEDDNHEHMAFGVVGRWGEKGVTIVRILPYSRLAQIMPTSP